MKGQEIMEFLKGLDQCQEKTEELASGKVIAYNNLDLIAKYRERMRRAYEKI